MVSTHKISPASFIHTNLFHHIFGDYMAVSTKPRPEKKMKDLKYRFKAHNASVRICPLDPVCAMNFLENRNAVDVVNVDVRQLKQDFQYSLYLSDRVFRLEGVSIARFISPTQLRDMKHGPLAEIPASIDRLRKTALRMLRTALRCLGVEKEVIDKMMVNAAMKNRVRRYVDFIHDPTEVAKKMVSFWSTKNDSEHRRQTLKKAMEDRVLQIRRNAVFTVRTTSGGTLT